MDALIKRLDDARRIVVKVGSALVTNAETGGPDEVRIQTIARDLADLYANQHQIVVVSSGSISIGRAKLKLRDGPLKLEEKQAAAACGQIGLMRAWEDALSVHEIPVAQALITPDVTETRRRWLNAKNTLETLLEAGAVPIVNENDTVATEEIRYGDNDRLAARVAQMIGADVLILLSDIDGLYTADPRQSEDAEHISIVQELTPDILAMGGEANSEAGMGSGGMATKLEAARIAHTAGCATIITMGETSLTEPGPIQALRQGAKATLFVPELSPESARKQWLAGALQPAGHVVVDQGAVKALLEGMSLLPAGVVEVFGPFLRGDAIDVQSRNDEVIARGISAYNSDDAALIMGHNSSDIPAILGFDGRPALIHRDDLILVDRNTGTH